MPLVQIIIPNWNGLALLKTCLAALEVQTFKDFAITVVDNGSNDGSFAWLREHAPPIHLIANAENRGFAAAINQGIRATDSKYVVTLNNDTEPFPGWLEALVSAADKYRGVGMFASKMLFPNEQHTINSTGICLDPVGIAWDCRGGKPDDPEENTPTEVFGPCAGAALYRREMLTDIGLFDEDFFAYLEDVDLAWRGQLAGWRALYVPTARVYHCHSGTLGEGSPFKNYLLGRNKVWLIFKNYPLPHYLAYLPLIAFYDLSAALYALVTRRDIHAMRGRIVALVKLPQVYRKRRAIQSRIRNSKHWRRSLDSMVFPWQVPQRYRHLAHLRDHQSAAQEQGPCTRH